jgi:putative SOS response-associated peptidase YedK
MPVILAPEKYDLWLKMDIDAKELFMPYPAEALRAYPISTRVNSPKNDEPSIIDPVEPRFTLLGDS